MSRNELHNGVTAEYTSLEELRDAWGLKPFKKRTRDENKLASQREKFNKKHICDGCKKPMEYIGGNIMSCTNPDCKGIPIEKVNASGETVVYYATSFNILDETGAEIAQNIFD